MSDIAPAEWLDGQPHIVSIVYRADRNSEHERIAIGDIVIRALGLHFGSTVWERRINLGKSPSHVQIREALASLTADVLIGLEGQR